MELRQRTRVVVSDSLAVDRFRVSRLSSEPVLFTLTFVALVYLGQLDNCPLVALVAEA